WSSDVCSSDLQSLSTLRNLLRPIFPDCFRGPKNRNGQGSTSLAICCDSAGLLSRSQASSLSQRVTQCARAARGHFSFLVRRTQAALGPTHKKRKTPLWGALLVLSFVIPLGFEPRTLTLKVLCSTS